MKKPRTGGRRGASPVPLGEPMTGGDGRHRCLPKSREFLIKPDGPIVTVVHGPYPPLARKPMKFLAFALCGLVLSGSAGADQTCKAKANQRKLAGQALVNFVQQCEFEVLKACQDKTAHQPDNDRLMQECAVKAMGMGSKWCEPHSCRTNSDCSGGARCSVCWAGLCGE